MADSRRILIVLPMYGGSLPIGRYCDNALRGLGHLVEYFEAPAFYSVFEALKGLRVGLDRLDHLENSFHPPVRFSPGGPRGNPAARAPVGRPRADPDAGALLRLPERGAQAERRQLGAAEDPLSPRRVS